MFYLELFHNFFHQFYKGSRFHIVSVVNSALSLEMHIKKALGMGLISDVSYFEIFSLISRLMSLAL